MTKTTRRFVLLGTLFFGSVFTLAVATEPDGSTGPTTPPASSGTYDHQTLQSDAWMTERMSQPAADTGAGVHRHDQQLVHSDVGAFLRDLEAHQAAVDRMLARPARS